METEYKEITEEEIEKIVGLVMIEIKQLIHPLRKYGQSDYCDGAISELRSLFHQVAQKAAGLDEPFGITRPFYTNRDSSGRWNI